MRSAGLPGDDAAAVDEHDAVAEALRLFHMVGAVQDGGPARRLPAYRGEDALPGLRVDADGGLVQQHHARFMQETARQVEAPLHATGERRHDVVGPILEADEPQTVVGHATHVAQVEQPGKEQQILTRRQRRIDGQRLRHQAENRAHAWRVPHHIVAGHTDATVIRTLEGGQHR